MSDRLDISKIKIRPVKEKPLEKLDMIKVPNKKHDSLFEKIGDYAPYYLLERGASSIKKLLDIAPLPSPLPFILRWTAKAISFSAKKLSIDEK